MTTIQKFVDLSNSQPLFIGGERLVYEDPRCSHWLIKVSRMQNGRENKLKNRFFKRYSKWRYGAMKSWYKEQEEYLALLWRQYEVPDFVAGFYGYCQTSEGPGMVVEKVTDGEGNIASTVASIVNSASSEEKELLLILIDDFFDKMIDAQCVAKDLHMANVAVSGDFEKLVLIDGLGDGVLIKTKKFLRYFRIRDMEKKRLRFKQFVRGSMYKSGTVDLGV